MCLHQIDLHTRLNRKELRHKTNQRQAKRKEIGFHCELFLTCVLLFDSVLLRVLFAYFLTLFAGSLVHLFTCCSPTISAYKVMRACTIFMQMRLVFFSFSRAPFVVSWSLSERKNDSKCMHSTRKNRQSLRYGLLSMHCPKHFSLSLCLARNCSRSKYVYDSEFCFEL